MSFPFTIDAQRRGRLFGRRTHHGGVGCLCIAAGVVVNGSHPALGAALVGVGAALCVHDWDDRSRWIVDFLRKPAMSR